MTPKLYTFNEYSVMRGPTCPDTGYSEDYVLLADCEELPKDAKMLTREQVQDLLDQALNVEYPDQIFHLYFQLDELFGGG